MTIKRKIDNLGRLVIPKDVRKALEIIGGDTLLLTVEDDKIIIEKEKENEEKVLTN